MLGFFMLIYVMKWSIIFYYAKGNNSWWILVQVH